MELWTGEQRYKIHPGFINEQTSRPKSTGTQAEHYGYRIIQWTLVVLVLTQVDVGVSWLSDRSKMEALTLVNLRSGSIVGLQLHVEHLIPLSLVR